MYQDHFPTCQLPVRLDLGLQTFLIAPTRLPTTGKVKVVDFFSTSDTSAPRPQWMFFSFSGFRGIFYILIWISWSSVILWCQAFGERTFQTSKGEKLRQEQRQNILQTCLLSDLCFYRCFWQIDSVPNKTKYKLYINWALVSSRPNSVIKPWSKINCSFRCHLWGDQLKFSTGLFQLYLVSEQSSGKSPSLNQFHDITEHFLFKHFSALVPSYRSRGGLHSSVNYINRLQKKLRNNFIQIDQITLM